MLSKHVSFFFPSSERVAVATLTGERWGDLLRAISPFLEGLFFISIWTRKRVQK
jgi:hypothetical protein